MPDTLRESATVSSPLQIPWSLAWWASDPNWTPPADGASVTSWRQAGLLGSAFNAINDGRSGYSAPVYRASVPRVNGRPALQFTAASTQVLYFGNTTAPYVPIPAIGPPWSIVAIYCPTWSSYSAQILVDGFTPSLQDNTFRPEGGQAGNSCTVTAAGVPLDVRTPTISSFQCYATSTSPQHEFNGRVYAGTAVVGQSYGGSLGYINTIGARYSLASQFFDGYLMFIGVYNGDLWASGLWSPFKAWAKSYYGIGLMVP